MASPEKRKRSKSKDRKAEKGSERKKRGEKRKKQHSPGNDVVGKSGDEGGSRSGGKKARDKRGRGESQGRADAEGDPSPPPAGAAQATISVGSADPSHDPVIVSFPGGVPNRMLETEEREADRQTKRRVRFDGGDENEDGGGGRKRRPLVHVVEAEDVIVEGQGREGGGSDVLVRGVVRRKGDRRS